MGEVTQPSLGLLKTKPAACKKQKTQTSPLEVLTTTYNSSHSTFNPYNSNFSPTQLPMASSLTTPGTLTCCSSNFQNVCQLLRVGHN